MLVGHIFDRLVQAKEFTKEKSTKVLLNYLNLIKETPYTLTHSSQQNKKNLQRKNVRNYH